MKLQDAITASVNVENHDLPAGYEAQQRELADTVDAKLGKRRADQDIEQVKLEMKEESMLLAFQLSSGSTTGKASVRKLSVDPLNEIDSSNLFKIMMVKKGIYDKSQKDYEIADKDHTDIMKEMCPKLADFGNLESTTVTLLKKDEEALKALENEVVTNKTAYLEALRVMTEWVREHETDALKPTVDNYPGLAEYFYMMAEEAEKIRRAKK